MLIAVLKWGTWILMWNLVTWDTVWSDCSVLSLLTDCLLHTSTKVTPAAGAHGAAKEIRGITEYREAQIHKMYRAFKTWCPPALIHILMTAILMTTNLAPMLIVMPWIVMRLERGKKLTCFHCTLKIHSAFSWAYTFPAIEGRVWMVDISSDCLHFKIIFRFVKVASLQDEI